MGGTSWVLSGAELSHEQGHLVSDLGWGQGRFWGEGAGDSPARQGQAILVLPLLSHGAVGDSPPARFPHL